MPAIRANRTNLVNLSFLNPKLRSIRVYDIRATPLPMIINAPIFAVTALTALSFIKNPVNGGSPPLFTKANLKFLEFVFINFTTGLMTIKYIKINHQRRPPEIEKIHPICTMPEKTTTITGEAIAPMVRAPSHTFTKDKNSFLSITNAINPKGATFCHV